MILVRLETLCMVPYHTLALGEGSHPQDGLSMTERGYGSDDSTDGSDGIVLESARAAKLRLTSNPA